MRHVIANAFGGPEQLMVEQTGQPQRVGVGDLLVDVEAAGVNYLDVMQRQGVSGMPLPFMPGLEGVGRVREVGKAADGEPALSVGQRVAWVNVPGSYASRLVLPAAQAVAIPDTFTIEQGLLFQSLTAQYLVTEYRHVQAGDRVLVHAAAGGVGQLLVQWFKHLGAWVVGTTSNQTKAAVARAAGADAVIDYGRDYAFADELKSLTEGRGVDLAIDSVGAATFASSLKSLARGGTLVSCGSSSGAPPAVNPLDLIFPCTRVAGGAVFSYVDTPAELQRRAREVLDGIEAGWLRLPQATAYDLGEAADAHRALEARQTSGKLYLKP
jgi:NADPH2:quinone reductase